jgi:hypothetical protein
MKKQIKIAVAILMALSLFTITVSSVNAEFCDDPVTDPVTGITTCRTP